MVAEPLPPAPLNEEARTAPSASEPVASAPDAAPTQDVQAAYLAVVSSAIAEFDADRFAEARSLFLRAHELWPSARTWRTLGMTAFELRMYPQAQAELQAALDDARRPLVGDQREHVEGLLAQTRAFVGRYHLKLEPADAELTVDGARITLAADGALMLSVGHHELRVRAPGHQDLWLAFDVQGREDQERDLTLAPSGPPAVVMRPMPSASEAARAAPLTPTAAEGPARREHMLRATMWTAAGVGAAGVVMAAVLGGVAIKQKHALDEHCPGHLCAKPYLDDRDQLKRVAAGSTAGVVIGAVGAATATVLWLLNRRSEQPPTAERGIQLRWQLDGLSGRF